jgi:hypothetical protein
MLLLLLLLPVVGGGGDANREDIAKKENVSSLADCIVDGCVPDVGSGGSATGGASATSIDCPSRSTAAGHGPPSAAAVALAATAARKRSTHTNEAAWAAATVAFNASKRVARAFARAAAGLGAFLARLLALALLEGPSTLSLLAVARAWVKAALARMLVAPARC